MKRTGIEPQFICEIIRDGVSTFHGQVEYTAQNTPMDGPVYPTVESFGAYSSVAKTDGFGSLETLQVVFNDFFGFFKEGLETEDVREWLAKIYLVVRQAPLQPSVVLLLDGRFSDPIEWDETQRNFTVGLIANVIFDEFGFYPDWLENLNIQESMTEEPWPHIFGNWASHKMVPICNVPSAVMSYGIIIQSPGTDGEYYDYDNPEDEHIYQDNESFTNIYSDQLSGFPDATEGSQYFQIDIPGGKLIFAGTNAGSVLVTSAAMWNIPYFTNIVLWSPQQYNAMLPYVADNATYIPNVATLTGYGSQSLTAHFNIYGELIQWPAVVSHEFPSIGFNPDQDPWLRGLYIFFQAFRIYTDVNDERQIEYMNFWAKVIEQTDLNITLDEITDAWGQNVSLSGYRPCFIYYAAGNKVFYPSSGNALCGGGSSISFGSPQRRWPDPPVKVQRGSTANGGFVLRPDASGIYDRIYKIPKGTTIRPVDWWPTMLYPISLDLVTTVQSVGIRLGRRLMLLNISQFNIFRFDKAEGTWTILTEGLAGPPWIPPVLWAMDHDYLPDECTFLYLRPSVSLLMAKDIAGNATAEVLVTCKNELNTDERVFEFIVEKYTDYTASVNSDLYCHHPVQLLLRKKEAVPAVISRLAWEHAKIIKVQVSHATMIDCLQGGDFYTPTFNESNIENGALQISYTGEEDIRNYLEGVPDDGWTKGRYVVRNTDSIAKLTELRESYSIGFNRHFSTPEIFPPDPLNQSHWPDTMGEYYEVPGDPPTMEQRAHRGRGYNRVLLFWLQDYSNSWMTLNFNTFMDAVHFRDSILVGSDQVTIDFQGALDFIPESVGLPLGLTPLYGEGSLPQAQGLLTELTIDPNEWAISMAVKLPIVLGSNTPRYVVEE